MISNRRRKWGSPRLRHAVEAVRAAVLVLPQQSMMEMAVRLQQTMHAWAMAASATIGRTASRAWGSTRSWFASAVMLHLLPVAIALLALGLGLLSLNSGLGDDDLLHRQVLRSASVADAISDLYVFLDPDSNSMRMESGDMPWWSWEEAKVAFWRPLSAFSLWLDYQLWPSSQTLMHAHSALWYAVLCGMAAWLFLRLLQPLWVGAVASFLFAVSATHIDSMRLLASRNVLLCATFGLLTLILHDRWRQDGWRRAAWLAPFSLGLSLLSAEAGIAIVGFLLAYALWIDGQTIGRRALSLLPYAAVAIAWHLLYKALGYGAAGSAFYIDPAGEPLRLGLSLIEYLPVLLAAQFAMPDPAVYAILAPGWRRVFWAVCATLAVLMMAVLRPVLRRSANARFWATGMLLSVLPICAVTLASGRHLMFVGLGAYGLVAQLVENGIGRRQQLNEVLQRQSAARGVAIALLVLHGLMLPLVVPLTRDVFSPLSRAMMDVASAVPEEVQSAVIINSPSPGQLMYARSLGTYQGRPLVQPIRVLAPGHYDVEVTRLDEKTLLLQPEHGYLLAAGAMLEGWDSWWPAAHAGYAALQGDGFFRSPDRTFESGETVTLSDVAFAATKVDEAGRPLEATARFATPLEDTSVAWLWWDWDSRRYLPFSVPPVGSSTTIQGGM